MFRPNPAIFRFSSERISVFIKSMRLCNDGEISSSVGLIITITEIVAGEGGLWCGYCADWGCSASVGVYFLFSVAAVLCGISSSFFPSSISTSMSVSLLGSVERKNKKMKCVCACGLVAQCDKYQKGGNEKAVLTQPHRFYKHWYSFGRKPDDGRIRPKHVVLYSSSNKQR